MPVLARAQKALVAYRAAETKVDAALLEAAEAGWTMREIGVAVGLSAATVNRAVKRAEIRETFAS